MAYLWKISMALLLSFFAYQEYKKHRSISHMKAQIAQLRATSSYNRSLASNPRDFGQQTETPSCLEKFAKLYPNIIHLSGELCLKSSSVLAVNCFAELYDGEKLAPQQAAQICQNGRNEKPVECYQRFNQYFDSGSELLAQLCQANRVKSSYPCFDYWIDQFPHNPKKLANFCTSAKTSSFQCLRKVLQEDPHSDALTICQSI